MLKRSRSDFQNDKQILSQQLNRQKRLRELKKIKIQMKEQKQSKLLHQTEKQRQMRQNQKQKIQKKIKLFFIIFEIINKTKKNQMNEHYFNICEVFENNILSIIRFKVTKNNEFNSFCSILLLNDKPLICEEWSYNGQMKYWSSEKEFLKHLRFIIEEIIYFQRNNIKIVLK